MRKCFFTFVLATYTFCILPAQEQTVRLSETADLEQVYADSQRSNQLLAMNDLNMEFGYVLYSFVVRSESGRQASLQLENIRDYAAVYVNNILAGTLTDEHKSLTLDLPEGESTVGLYVENIGRITYGPEILDNSKGLFGKALLDGTEIQEWQITSLNIRDCEVANLKFSPGSALKLPGFYRGYVTIDKPEQSYLDITGWGMGEVWVNGQHLGSYWEEEAQKSIPMPAAVLKKGKNEVVVFDLKNNGVDSIRVTNQPVFN